MKIFFQYNPSNINLLIITVAMKKVSFKLVKILFISSLLMACGGGGKTDSSADSEQPTPAPTPAPKSKSIVAIGDSIGTGFNIATPWPTRLNSILNIPVDNNSVSGEQTGYGLSIINGLLDSKKPTHVVILLGTNDAIRGSVPTAISNLQSMVNTARNKNVIPVIVTLPPITRSSSENSRAAQISSGIRKLQNAVVADARAALNNSHIGDGVHPNNEGQRIIAETIAQKIQ